MSKTQFLASPEKIISNITFLDPSDPLHLLSHHSFCLMDPMQERRCVAKQFLQNEKLFIKRIIQNSIATGALYFWTDLSQFVKSPFWWYISATKHPGSLYTPLNKGKCPFELQFSLHTYLKPFWQGFREHPYRQFREISENTQSKLRAYSGQSPQAPLATFKAFGSPRMIQHAH